jgi:hypothetical protein
MTRVAAVRELKAAGWHNDLSEHRTQSLEQVQRVGAGGVPDLRAEDAACDDPAEPPSLGYRP